MAWGSTPEEKALAEQLEEQIKNEKSILRTAGFIDKVDQNSGKIRFGNLAYQGGIRVFVNTNQLGPQLQEILKRIQDYLNKVSSKARAVKGVSGMVSLGNITKAILNTKIDSKVPQLAGRYFEWCVYKSFCTALKKYDPDVKETGERADFYNQRSCLKPYRAKYPTLEPQIEQLATKAVHQFFTKNGIIDVRQWSIQALAGSNKTGDLKLYNSTEKKSIILELKLYRSPSRIHWATLDDFKNFGFSYMAIMKQHKASSLPIRGMKDKNSTWYSHVGSGLNNKPLVGPGAETFDAWINHIHAAKGAEFMMQSLMRRGTINGINVKTAAGALNYFMMKGDKDLFKLNTKKQAIVGIRVDGGSKNEGRIEALFDIDFLEPSRSIKMNYDRNGVTFAYDEPDKSSNVILSVNATEKSLREWATKMNYVVQQKAKHPNNEGLPEDAHWNSLPQIEINLQMYQAYWQSKKQ